MMSEDREIYQLPGCESGDLGNGEIPPWRRAPITEGELAGLKRDLRLMTAERDALKLGLNSETVLTGRLMEENLAVRMALMPCLESESPAELLKERIDRLTAERDALQTANRTYAVSVCPELDRTIAELQSERNALKTERDAAQAQLKFALERQDRLEKLHKQVSDEGNAALAEIARLREDGRWIPVGERLPDDDIEVLAAVDGEVMMCFRSTGLWWSGEGLDAYMLSPTHWMDLPAGPVEVAESKPVEGDGKPDEMSCMSCGRWITGDEICSDVDGNGDEILVCEGCRDEERGRRWNHDNG